MKSVKNSPPMRYDEDRFTLADISMELTHNQNPRVLMVEDTLSLARTYMEYLRDEPIDLVHVATGGEGFAELEKQLPEAILLDLMLPDISGLEILKRVHDQELPVAVVVITAHGSVNTAVEAMRLGAFDFIVKPFNADRLRVTLNNALENRRLARIVKVYRDSDRDQYFGFIGASLKMQTVYRIIDSAAESKATVFITGESGTGKEVCAEAIHNRSNRAGRPFVALNCGAIPRDLMESEVFGHTKGAFTGAVAEREGAASRADGGTLFLDEICELDPDLQTKLLRFVQTSSFEKVGGSETKNVDIRIVCATNRDPVAEVAAGRFREDLFYRLHVIPLALPRLSEREGDVLAIARRFLADYSAEEQKAFTRFTAEVEAVMLAYNWPGNIRQLQNVVRNMVVLNEGEEITEAMLPAPLDDLVGAVPSLIADENGSGPGDRKVAAGGAAPGTIRPLVDVEREAIEQAIMMCHGNVPKAAASLGVSASTLYRKRTAWEQAEGKRQDS